jgi:hypothetical protein
MDMAKAYRPTIPVVPTSRDSTVAETDCTEINLHRVGDDDFPENLDVAGCGRVGPPTRRTTLIGFRVARTLGPQRVSHALEGR